jgi:oligopeptidase B
VGSSTKDEDGIQGLSLLSPGNHKLEVFAERKPNRKVSLQHKDGFFYIRANDTGDNFRLAKVPVPRILDESSWEEVLPTDANRFITSFQVLARGIAVGARNLGLSEIGLLDEASKTLKLIPMAEKAYDAKLRSMPYEAEFLRFSYSSLSKPPSVLEATFDTLQTTVRKTREIPSGHNPEDYTTDRLFITARDGVDVPVSLVYRKDKFTQDATKPLFLYGYGSYGISIAPEFLEWMLPFLDKGFVYAIAHVRGGSDMGYSWYLDGKMEKKLNTFHDFIDVANGLIDQKYTSAGNITAMGGSAGGLLMGTVVNKAPELFKSIVTMVPFVDLVNTMLDETLPLTPGEYKEWGNPATDPEVFERLLSYSPYDNLAADIQYPAMYITGGLYDFRVTYWEMLKYTAKLRHLSPQTPAWLRMKTAGHGGGTTLEDRLRERGEVYAFTLKMHGLI